MTFQKFRLANDLPEVFFTMRTQDFLDIPHIEVDFHLIQRNEFVKNFFNIVLAPNVISISFKTKEKLPASKRDLFLGAQDPKQY